MAINYVKFIRGTPAAFQKLAVKDKDTLYFISETDSQQGYLYLGNKLISEGTANLEDLNDLLLGESISDKDILSYDAESGKWVNKSVISAIDIMTGADSENQGGAGLVPAPGINQQNHFLRGDGSWAAIKDIKTKVIEIEVKEENDINTSIKDWYLLNNTVPQNGDIVIVKIITKNNGSQYNVYIYNKLKWIALSGSSYSIDNIYFTDDLKITTDLGYVTIGSSGMETIPAKGKTFKEVFETVFCKEITPIITQPSSKFLEPTTLSLEAGSYYTPSWELQFDPGKYEFGPNTNVAIIKTEIFDNYNNASDKMKGSFKKRQILDNMQYCIYSNLTHSAGSIPLTNLKNSKEELKILQNIISNQSKTITSYRNSFYGSFNSKTFEITSEYIRSLTSSDREMKKGDKISILIPTGSQRAVIAYPAILGEINSICDRNGLGANIKSSFHFSQINVEGANGYDAIPYYVYFIDRAEPNKTPNYYDVII